MSVGFIPNEFKQHIYEPLTSEDFKILRWSCGYFTEVNGKFVKRYHSNEEIESRVKKCVGVKDLRDGKFYPNLNTDTNYYEWQ